MINALFSNNNFYLKALREFGIGAQILLDQGVNRLKLISSKSSRVKGIEGYDLEIVEHIIIPPKSEGDQSSD